MNINHSNFVLITESWILITGGYNGNGMSNSTLFNWITKEQCSLPSAPYALMGHSLTSKFGVPIFCSGALGSGVLDSCYKFNTTNKGWDQVRLILLILTENCLQEKIV